MAANTKSVLDAFVAAMASRDLLALRGVFADDAIWWINLTERDQPIQSLFDAMELESQHVKELHAEVIGSVVGPDGFGLQLHATGTTAGGASLSIPLCYFATVHGGRITRLDEYTSADQTRPLLKEMFKR